MPDSTKVVHDTVYKYTTIYDTTFSETVIRDTVYIDETDILNKVDAFYSSSWSNLTTIIAVLLGLVGVIGILLPIVVTFLQNRKFNVDRDSILEQIDDARDEFNENITTQTENLQEEIQESQETMTESFEKQVEDKMNEVNERIDKSMHRSDAHLYYLKSMVYFEKEKYDKALYESMRSLNSTYKSERHNNIRVGLNNIADALDRLKSYDVVASIEEKKGISIDYLIEKAESINKEKYETVIQRLRDSIEALIKREEEANQNNDNNEPPEQPVEE